MCKCVSTRKSEFKCYNFLALWMLTILDYTNFHTKISGKVMWLWNTCAHYFQYMKCLRILLALCSCCHMYTYMSGTDMTVLLLKRNNCGTLNQLNLEHFSILISRKINENMLQTFKPLCRATLDNLFF